MQLGNSKRAYLCGKFLKKTPSVCRDIHSGFRLNLPPSHVSLQLPRFCPWNLAALAYSLSL